MWWVEGSEPFRGGAAPWGDGPHLTTDGRRSGLELISPEVSESPLCPRHTFYFHCLSLPWNCDDRALGRQRHLEERPPLNPPHRDFNHDPSLEGSLRRDLNELPQVRRDHRRCRRCRFPSPGHIFERCRLAPVTSSPCPLPQCRGFILDCRGKGTVLIELI